MTIEYEDGRTEEQKVRPKHIAHYESRYGEFTERATSVYKLAWICSGCPDKFDEWLETVDDVRMAEPAKANGDAETSAEDRPTPEPSQT